MSWSLSFTTRTSTTGGGPGSGYTSPASHAGSNPRAAAESNQRAAIIQPSLVITRRGHHDLPNNAVATVKSWGRRRELQNARPLLHERLKALSPFALLLASSGNSR